MWAVSSLCHKYQLSMRTANFQDGGKTRKDPEVLGQLQALTRSGRREGLEV